jgi:formylglycine-generating enzyme required for sulfatase activity
VPGQVARVNRGGSWNNDNPSNVRAANRNRNDPSNRNNNLGFRCAQSSPPACAPFTDAAPVP